MSLRWTAYVTIFRPKWTSLEESVLQSFFVWIVDVKDVPSMWKLGRIPFKNVDFQSIFAHSPSAVTRNEKSSVNTNRKSTTGFPMSLRWTVYVAPKPPKAGLKN